MNLKYMKIVLCVLTLFLISSCQRQNNKKEVGYEITGQIKNTPDSTSVIISNMQFVDSTMAINGKFSFVGSINRPQRVLLSLKNAPNRKSFWLENAQINIIGDYDNLEYAELTGGENQRLANLLWQQKKPILKIIDQYGSQLENKSLEKLKRDSIYDAYELLTNKLDDIKKKFVKEHPNTLESVILLAVNRSTWDKDSVRAIFTTMDRATQNTKYGNLISEYLNLPTNPQIGEMYVDFALQNTEGKTVDFSQLMGTYTLIDFWASWCIPCRKENPILVELFEKYHKNGFKIVGVSLDTDKSKWLKAIEDDKLLWDNLNDSGELLNSNSISLLYDVRGIPDNILVDQDGIILGRNLRSDTLKDSLQALFDF